MYCSPVFGLVSYVVALILILHLPHSAAGCCNRSLQESVAGQLRVDYRCKAGRAPTRLVKLDHAFVHLFNISTPTARHLYVAATSKVFLSFSPDLWDALTFNVLSAKNRIAAYHVRLPSSQDCPELSEELRPENAIATLLRDSLHDDEQIYVRQLEQTSHNKSYYEAVSNSGVFLFMPLGLMSIFYVFVVLPFARNHVQKRMRSRKKPGPSMVTLLRRLSTIEDGVHLASTMVLASFVIAWAFNAACYYTLPPHSARNVAGTKETPIGPFTVNLAFLFLTIFISFMGSLGFQRLSRGKTRGAVKKTRRSCYYVVSCFGEASLVVLVTCLAYQSLFLLISVMLDWRTAVSNLTSLITVITMLYLAFPTVLHQLYIARVTQQCGILVLVFILTSATPLLYYVCLIGFDHLLREEDCSAVTTAQLTVVLALSLLCVIFQGTLFLLVLKHGSTTSNGSGGTDAGQRRCVAADTSGVEAGKQGQEDLSDKRSYAVSTHLAARSQGNESIAVIILHPKFLDTVLRVIGSTDRVPSQE